MGAGLSTKQFNNRVYKRLQRIKRELENAGVSVKYENYQLCSATDGKQFSFNISYCRLNASNGETAGLPSVRLQVGANPIERFDHLSFDRGIARIVEVVKQAKSYDFSIENHGSIVLLRPLTAAAHEWIAAHISDDAQEFGGATVVEPRYVESIVGGIADDGLSYKFN